MSVPVTSNEPGASAAAVSAIVCGAAASRAMTGASFVPLIVIVTFSDTVTPCPSSTIISKVAVTTSPSAKKSRTAGFAIV